MITVKTVCGCYQSARCNKVLGLILGIFSIPMQAWASDAARGSPILSEVAKLEGAGGLAVVFSGDGRRVVTAGRGEARVWDADAFKPVGPPIQYGGNLQQVGTDRRGEHVLTLEQVTENGRLIKGEAKVWDGSTGKLILVIHQHGDFPLSGATISPDGTWVATCSERDPRVRLWEVRSGREKLSLEAKSPLLSVKFEPTGSLLVGAGATDTIWSTKSWQIRASFPGTTAAGPPLPAIAVGVGRIAVPRDDSFAVYDLGNGKKLADNTRHALHLDEFNSGLAMSEDARYVATTSTTGGKVWNAESGEPLLDVPDAFTGTPVFSPDGRFVVFDTPSKPSVWCVPEGTQLRLPSDSNTVAASFSPTTGLLAVGTYRSSTRVFAVSRPTRQVPSPQHADEKGAARQ